MNKVICNICGTSYPENATQCPICGFARSSESLEATEGESSYQYVKGGRFSKANVKKRNLKNQKSTAEQVDIEPENKSNSKKNSGNTAMIVVVILLLLAIIAVVGYIALRFFLPNDFMFEGLDSFTKPTVSQEEIPQTEETEPETEPVCTAVKLDKTTLAFEGINSTYKLNVTVEPINTTDTISFSSSDEAVATVSNSGMITSVGEGSAIITVTCGSVTAECSVTCTIPVTEPEGPQLALNRKEITFDMEGQTWMLYDGEISIDDIAWSSDDNKVATIVGGKVTAVGNGDTTVYGIYGEQNVSCLIHCKFDDTNNSSGNISEAAGESEATSETTSEINDEKKYMLYNPTGRSDDVTMKVGRQFTLKLVDEDKNEVSDVTWTVSKKSVCTYSDGIVKALAAGKATVTAEYNGKTYTCIVRVKE